MKILVKKPFFLGIFIGLVLLFSFFTTLPDGKLHLVFCDVGQGDAAYIRTPTNADILIDGGPNDSVLSCLGRYMPFYDRTIDVVILSHPQNDHVKGLVSVLERYDVKYIILGVEGIDTEVYRKLLSIIAQKKIPFKNLFSGDSFSLGEARMTVLWPSRTWVASQFTDQSHLSNLGNLSDLRVLGAQTVSADKVNDFSYYLKLTYCDFDVLFTGDGDSRVQPEIEKSTSLSQVEILKYPHHGSKTAMLEEFLERVKPALTIISVGRNSYGHPSKEALELLNSRQIQIRRTDQKGDIEIISDGKNWK